MTDADAQVAAAIEKHGVPRWVAFVPMRVREQASVELKRTLQAEARISEGWSRHGDRLVFGRSDNRTTLIYWAKQNLFAVLTIKEIADAAGVPQTTVRTVLTERPDIFRKSEGRTYEVRDADADRKADKR